MTKTLSGPVRQFLKKMARKGGKARAAKYDKRTLSKWGRLGGRPSKAKKREKR